VIGVDRAGRLVPAHTGAVHAPGTGRRATRRAVVIAGLVLGLAVTGVLAWSRPFTSTADLGTALAVLVILGWAGTRQRPRRARALHPAGRVAWTAWLVALATLELWTLVEQPRSVHPTISSLIDPLLSSTPGRAAAALLWLGLGCWLAEV
jgi:hypothetical protein